MKKHIFLLILLVVFVPCLLFAADSDVPTMTEDSTPGGDSLVYTVDDPGGTPVDRKATLTNVTKLLCGLGVEVPDAADDGKYLQYEHTGTLWQLATPPGGGDMTQAVWDGDSDGFIDADAGGTDVDTSASTGVPSVSSGTWSVAATLVHELGGLEADVSAYDGLVHITSGTTSAKSVSANGLSLIAAADYAAMRTLLDLEAGTDFYSISAADTAFEGELDNSAGLAAALSDETGTGVAVFGTNPTLTGAVIDGTLDANGIVALGDDGDNFSVASDGIDIDTSGNITNGGTIACGKVTSSAAFESATGVFDVTGAAGLTVGSVDVTAITLQTDDTGDGTDLVLPAQGVNGSEMLNNTVTTTQLAAALTFADGDLLDMSGVTMTASADEGIALPTYANVAPTTEKYYVSYDASNNALMVRESGGWVNASQGTGAATTLNFVVTQAEGSLSDESVLTAGYAIDVTDAGGDGGAVTVALDTTEISADGSDTWSDNSQASIVWTFDVTGTDHTMTAGNGLMTFGDAVTVTDTLTASNGIALGTSKSITGTTGLTVGGGTETVAINSSDWDIDATGIATGMGAITSDGVITATGFTVGSAAITEAELEIIDGATLSTSDINIIDGISDSGSLTAAELLYVDGVTSAVQTQLDARCLESVFGDAIEADDLELSGTTLQLVAEIPHLDATATVSADWTFADVIALIMGSNSDWNIEYDETTDDRLEFVNIQGTSGDSDVYWDLNDNGADSTFTVTNSDGTYDANLVVDKLTVNGTDGSNAIILQNNTSISPSGHQLYIEGNELKVSENGSEESLLTDADGATLTGTTWDFSSVTNLLLPSAADSASEIGVNDTSDVFSLGIQDGAGAFITYDYTGIDGNDTYVMAWNESNNQFEAAAQAGGSPAWQSISDPTGDATIDHDAGEETNFTFTGNYTTGTQFLVQQLTGNPSGGVLFEARGADADSVVARFGDGTNMWSVSTTGQLSNAGTGTINFAAASDILVGGSQIGFEDIAEGIVALDSAIQFGDAQVFIESDDDGYLDLDADGDIRLNTTTTTSGLGTFLAGIMISDGQTIKLDESAGDPNDCDVSLSAADGVLTIVGSNGVNNESITVDVDQTSNTVIIGTGSGVTEVDFGIINLATDALDLSSGSITNLAVGGLPDNTIDNGCMADNAIDSAELVAGSVDLAHLAAGIKSGSDATVITGTAGTNTYCAIWNADGDLVDGPGVPYVVGGTDVADADVADDITITAGSQIASGSPSFTTVTASTSMITPLLDAAGAEDMDYGSVDVTDHTFTTDDCTVVIDGGVTVSTGDTITLGSTAWNSGDSIDGEAIAADTIDDDSIDFSDVTLADMAIDGTPGSDGTYEGIIISGVNAGESITAGQLVYMDGTSNEWMLADADATSPDEFPALGMATESGSDGNPMAVLTYGVARLDSWSWSAEGVVLYLDETTPGGMTETAPTDSDDCVQPVAFVLAITSDTILFNPGQGWGIVP